jgi:hypothetical protein
MIKHEVTCDFCNKIVDDCFYHLDYRAKPNPQQFTYVDGVFQPAFSTGYDMCKRCFEKVERKV